MRAHVFITDSDTFPIVRDNGFWSGGAEGIPLSLDEVINERNQSRRRVYFSIMADLLGTRIGDLAFFYERQRGFHGIYRVKSHPFFDPTPISFVTSAYPFRIEVDCLSFFEKPVAEDYLFSSKEYESKCWIWFYRKIAGVGRGANAISPEAAEALIEFLVKTNGNASPKPASMGVYPSTNRIPLSLGLPEQGRVPLEDMLRAWFMVNIDRPEHNDLRQIFGLAEDIEWFANNVPFHVTRRSIDILCFQSNLRYTGFSLRYRYTVVELKRDTARAEDVIQLMEYCRWVAGRLAGGEVELVQPVLVAFNFGQDAVIKAQNSDFNQKGIALVKYWVEQQNLRFARACF